jgi:uncharacterized LabA/DUF88 family protein
MKKERNIAFIDAQNLHLWTTTEKWVVDFKRFRVYLEQKFQVKEAYFFLWFLDEEQNELYRNVQKAWFIVEFREHNANMKGKKKGNVDVDIVFEVMRKIFEGKDFDKIVLVSGDGDYIKMVNYLIEKRLLRKMLFPNKQFSSLYNAIAYNYWVNLSLAGIRKKIEYKKRGALR